MARLKKPIAGTGPLADLARELRSLKTRAGDPTYEAMANRLGTECEGRGKTALSKADSGAGPPTWETVDAYLRGLRITDPELLDRVKQLWQKAQDADHSQRRERRQRPVSAQPDPTPGAGVVTDLDTAGIPTDAQVPGSTPAQQRRPLPWWLPRSAKARTTLAVMTLGVFAALTLASPVGRPVWSRISQHRLSGDRPTPNPAATPQLPPNRSLAELAARTLAFTDSPANGAFTYIHTETWRFDPNSSTITEPYTVVDESLSWAPDHSGRRTTVTSRDNAPKGAKVVQAFGPGELTIPDEPASADPAILRGQLGAGADAITPADLFARISNLYDYQVLDPRRRAAVLRILADTDGLEHDGPVEDRSGRPGIAISAQDTTTNIRSTLVFDDTSGELLSYRQIDVGAAETGPIAPPTTLILHLYLDHGYTSHIG